MLAYMRSWNTCKKSSAIVASSFKNTMGGKNKICLRCKRHDKRKDHQFCSDRCTKIAEKNAPMLIRVPKGHVMYDSGEPIHLVRGRQRLTRCISEEIIQESLAWQTQTADGQIQFSDYLDSSPAQIIRKIPVRCGHHYEFLCVLNLSQRQSSKTVQSQS